METQLTFSQQALTYLQEMTAGNNPAAPSTVRRVKSYLNARLLPLVGQEPLQKLENGAAKRLVRELSGDLKPDTVDGILQVFKAVIASAVDENGNQLYPRTWNSKFIDPPKAAPGTQNTPEIARETLQEAISGGSGQARLLYALLACSGLRIGEALAVRAIPGAEGNYWNRATKTIEVSSQIDIQTGMLRPQPKTAAGRRVVDLSTEANDFLAAAYPGGDGFLVHGGCPDLPANYWDLYHDLPEGVPPFHALRRFRITHLALANVPPELAFFWTGHAQAGVHGKYMKLGMKIEERREWAEKAGLGFTLPEAK